MTNIYHERHAPTLAHASAEANWRHAILAFQINREVSLQSNTALAVVSINDQMIVRRRLRLYKDRGDADEIIFAEAEIDATEAKILMNDLENVAICPFAPRHWGLDGYSQSVLTSDLELYWWGPEPESWKPLAAWFYKAWSQLQKALPKTDLYY